MSESTDANRVLSYYRRYVGDPDRTVDVYAGFGLFFVGLGLGAIGVLVFLYSATLPPDELSTYAVREVAGVAAAVGLPALLLGIVVLLPVDKRMLYVAAAGSAVTIAAVGIFVWAYPRDWNVAVPPDYSARAIAIYSVGIALVVAATGAALVAHRVERATGGATAAEPDDDDESGETVNRALIAINGDMPRHGHGLPSNPEAAFLGNGNYRLDGLKFHMSGWWQLVLTISTADKYDRAVFNFILEQ